MDDLGKFYTNFNRSQFCFELCYISCVTDALKIVGIYSINLSKIIGGKGKSREGGLLDGFQLKPDDRPLES